MIEGQQKIKKKYTRAVMSMAQARKNQWFRFYLDEHPTLELKRWQFMDVARMKYLINDWYDDLTSPNQEHADQILEQLENGIND